MEKEGTLLNLEMLFSDFSLWLFGFRENERKHQEQ